MVSTVDELSVEEQERHAELERKINDGSISEAELDEYEKLEVRRQEAEQEPAPLGDGDDGDGNPPLAPPAADEPEPSEPGPSVRMGDLVRRPGESEWDRVRVRHSLGVVSLASGWKGRLPAGTEVRRRDAEAS